MQDRPQSMVDIVGILYSDIKHFSAFMKAQEAFKPLQQQLSSALAIEAYENRRTALSEFFETCERLVTVPDSKATLLHTPWTQSPV